MCFAEVKLATLVLQHAGQNRAGGPQLSSVLTPPKLKYVSPDALCKLDVAEVLIGAACVPNLWPFTSLRRACFPVRRGIYRRAAPSHLQPERCRFLSLARFFEISPCAASRESARAARYTQRPLLQPDVRDASYRRRRPLMRPCHCRTGLAVYSSADAR
jgi:hypothetical protein